MTRPSADSAVPPAVAEQVTAGAQRTGMLRDRAASLAEQVTPRDPGPAEADRAAGDRLRAACAVAAAFYRAQLDGPDGAGPTRYLASRGVPVDGRWQVGYAPDRPTAVVNELRRHGFTDTEILASGLAATSRTGQLVDRFRHRIMIGVRDHRDPDQPLVAFVGHAPPRASADVPPVLHTPATAIHRPGEILFGLAEQRDQHRSDTPPVVAADPLAAIHAAETGVTAVAPCTPTLTARQAAALATAVDTATGVVVAVDGGEESRRATERAYSVLAPVYRAHPTRPGPLLAAQTRDLHDTRPLLDVVVIAHVQWASRFISPSGRQGAARTVQALLADADPATAARLADYTTSRLGIPVARPTAPPGVTASPETAPVPEVLAGAATPTGPPPPPEPQPAAEPEPEPAAELQPAAEPEAEPGAQEIAATLDPAAEQLPALVDEEQLPHPRADRPAPIDAPAIEDLPDEPVRGPSPETLAGVPAEQIRDAAGPEQLLLDFGGAGSPADRGTDPGAGRTGPAGRGLPGQARPAEQREDAGGGDRPSRARPDRPRDRDRGRRRDEPAAGGRVDAADGAAASGVAGDRRSGSGDDRAGRPARPVTETADPAASASPVAAAAGSAPPETPPAGANEQAPSAAEPAPATAERAPVAAPVFRPTGQQDLAPSGEVTRIRANLAALRTLRTIQAEQRPATADEQTVLARWSSWGAVPGIFETRTNHPNHTRYAAQRAELRELLTATEYAAAERTTLNAHYTDAGYVEPIWDALWDLGLNAELESDRPPLILEPGCGSGNFIGLAPARARMVGVELDPVTAGIAAALYPTAEIRTESFADTRAPSGAFDLTVGNVPFADVRLNDRRHNPGRHVMHNHFIIKSLHLTRPGGLVAVLTSRYTMDAANPAARREMAQVADLVAAVRLPSDAHMKAAGTAAILDLLILRRREPDREPSGPAWEQVRLLETDAGVEKPDTVNEYFLDRPGRVLGEMVYGRGMYRDGELLVQGSGDVAAQLRQALAEVVEQARADDLVMGPRGATAPAPVAVLADTDAVPGHLEARDDGTFTVVADGQIVAHPVPASQAAELRALLGLRDTVTALLAAEAANLDDGDEPGTVSSPTSPAALRAQLNDRYDAYVAKYGPVNRYTLARTGHVDAETGEQKLRRNYPQMGGFRRTDPDAATVFALEHFDDTTQSATKADIFHKRVILPRSPQLGADTPEDALAICLDQHGEVRLDEIARLLGVDETEARVALGDLVYEVPAAPEQVAPAAAAEQAETESAVPAAAAEVAAAEATLGEIAGAMGMDQVTTRSVGGVTETPGSLVEAAAYLSGNVRAKLRLAQQAAETDSRFEVNVRALQKVIPRDLGPGEIDPSLGAPFITDEEVQQFLRELLADPGLRVQHTGGSDWRVRGQRHGVLATSTWGTYGMAAPDIAQRLLTKTPVRVFDEDLDGKRVLDAEATAAAQAKATELEERFGAWVWEDPERSAAIAERYNAMFNATVPRSYVGVTRSLPGLSATFKPRPHQVEAVTRIVNEPAVGLLHAVGAGKTAVMAMSAMEQRRLGLVTKPAIVVPNHMLEQFTREFLQIYPQAKLLAAGRDDMTADRRRRFVGRCATGDWDAIIMAASFFERLGVSKEERERFLNDELQELRDKVEAASQQAAEAGEDPKRDGAVKRLQKALLRKEERTKAKLDAVKDPGVTFEQTGIDFLYRDELHELKNDAISSSIADAQVDGSDRAVDFRMKLGYLRRHRGMRVVCGATATPIANSVRELYVVTRQLRPDLLEATSTMDFDTWASVFAKVVTAIEVSPTGAGFQMRSRLAKYTNVPELSLMLRTFGDVRTPQDLNLPTPLLTERDDGQRAPHIITLEASPELQDFIAGLDQRVERIRNRAVEPEVDNMLKVSGEARAASLDLRLLGGTELPDGGVDMVRLVENVREEENYGKLGAAAEKIASIWADTRDNVYLVNPDADEPVEHPTRGALQIVFCDQGTPNNTKRAWNVYDELAAQLVDRGMPREKIRYIHEADTDAKKASLFAACRAGDVAVLIGSTARMGVGTNVQARAVALHHLDCPWRPADVTQREGRILRQGNQNAEVSIYRYVVTGSFDAFSWQTVARKGSFIDQIMRGSSDTREIDDVSDETLQAHQIKAIATGNPLLMDREEVAQEVTRLDRAERSHHNNQAALRRQISESQHWIDRDTRRLQDLDAAIARRIDTRGDKFTMTVAGHSFDKRADAGRALQHALVAAAAGITNTDQRQVTNLALIGGFDVDVTLWTAHDGLRVALRLNGLPDPTATMTFTAATTGDPTGLVRRFENQLAELGTARDRVQDTIDGQNEEIARANEQLGKPFARHAELVDARRRLRAIDAVIDQIADDSPVYGTPPPAVQVTVGDWMPPEIRDSLDPDQQAWLDQRVQGVAGDGRLQAAARAQELEEFASTFATALTKGLGDPGNPYMSVGIMLKCDESAWRDALRDAAGQAVHQAVRATAPPDPGAAPAPPARSAAAVAPMTPEEITAATAQTDKAALNFLTQAALASSAVRATISADDQAGFTTAFEGFVATGISGLSDPVTVDALTRLYADEAFRAGITTLVWTRLVPQVRAAHPPAVTAAATSAAAVAAQAFRAAPARPGNPSAATGSPSVPAQPVEERASETAPAPIATAQPTPAGPPTVTALAGSDSPAATSGEPAAAADTGNEPPAPASSRPADAQRLNEVPGYHWAAEGNQITVYDPNDDVVAKSEDTGRWGRFTAVVAGARIPMNSSAGGFATMAANQHRAAQLPAGQQDRVRIKIVADDTARAGYVVEVHGTSRDHDLDDRAVKSRGKFLWSGRKSAFVSGRQWTPGKVEENYGQMLQEFARQGRTVMIISHENHDGAAAPPRAAAPAAVAAQAFPPSTALAGAAPVTVSTPAAASVSLRPTPDRSGPDAGR